MSDMRLPMHCNIIVIFIVVLLQRMASCSGDKILPFAGGDPILFYFKDGAVMTFKTNSDLSLQMTGNTNNSGLSCISTRTGDQEEYEFIVHVVRLGEIALQSRKYPNKWYPKEAADSLKSDLELRYPNQDLSNRIAISRKGTYQPFTSSLVELEQATDPQDGPVKFIYLKIDGKYLTTQSNGDVTEEARASESAMFSPLIVNERHELIVASDSHSGHILANGNQVIIKSKVKQLMRMGNKGTQKPFPINGDGSTGQEAALFEVLVRPPATADGVPNGKVCLRNVFVGDAVNDQGTGGWLRMNRRIADGHADGQKSTVLKVVQMEPNEKIAAETADGSSVPPVTDPDTSPRPSEIVLESVKHSTTKIVALSVGADGSADSIVGQEDAIMHNDDNRFNPTVKTPQHKQYTRAGDTVNLRTLTHGNVISLISRETGQALRIDDEGIVKADGDYQQPDAQFIVSVRRPKPMKGSDPPAVVALQSVKNSDQWIKLFVGRSSLGAHVVTGGGGFECNFRTIDKEDYLLFRSVHKVHTDYLGIENKASKRVVAIPGSNPKDHRAHFTPRVIQSSPYLRFTAGKSGHMLTFEEGRTVYLRSLNCRGRANAEDERGLRVHPPRENTNDLDFPPRIECQGSRGSESRFLVRVIAPGIVALKSEHIADVDSITDNGQWWVDLHKTEPINEKPREIDGVIEIYSRKDNKEPNIRDNYTYLRGDGGSLSNLQLETYEAGNPEKSNTYVRLMAQRTPERKLGAIYHNPYRVDLGDSNEVYCDPAVVTGETIIDAELWTPIDPLFQKIHEFRGKK